MTGRTRTILGQVWLGCVLALALATAPLGCDPIEFMGFPTEGMDDDSADDDSGDDDIGF